MILIFFTVRPCSSSPLLRKLPPRSPPQSRHRRSAKTSFETMGTDKTAAAERAKKAAAKGKGKKSGRGGSSSRAALPSGWLQGDWMPSILTQADIDDMVEGAHSPQGCSPPWEGDGAETLRG